MWNVKRNISDKETWEIWERKALKKICERQKEEEIWKSNMNKKLFYILYNNYYKYLYNKPTIRQIIRRQRIRWFGHVARLTEEHKTDFEKESNGQKSLRGRPLTTWIQVVKQEPELM